MTSLTDLRATLDREADGVADTATAVRLSAVHHRVAVLRRRRRATGAGALALVLLAGVATAVWPRAGREPLPAAPIVLGQQAPTYQHSLGYTYRTDGTAASGLRQTAVWVPESDRPQLYSWTTDRASGVRVSLPEDRVVSSRTTRFHDFVVVPPGMSGRLGVSVPSGRVGVAHYTLTDAAPDGYTRDGISYRRSVTDGQLLGAVIAPRGATEVTLTVVAPRGRVSLAPLCAGLPPDFGYTVDIEGNGGISGGCAGGTAFDPGSNGGYGTRLGRPGQTVTLHAFVTEGEQTETPATGSFPRLRLGLGVYGPVAQRHLVGNTVPAVVEQDGHTWTLSGTYRRDHGTLDIPTVDQDRAGWMFWNAPGTVRPLFSVPGETPSADSFGGGGAAGMGGLWVPAGSPAHARLARDAGPFAVALYTRDD